MQTRIAAPREIGKRFFPCYHVETYWQLTIVNRVNYGMDYFPISHMFSHHQQLDAMMIEMPLTWREPYGIDSVRNIDDFAWTKPVFKLRNLAGCHDDRGVNPVSRVRLEGLKSLRNKSTIGRQMK